MKKRILLFSVFVWCLYANAQQPPANLPSLIDGLDSKIPVLHKGESPEDIIRKKIFVEVETGSSSVYAGESFLVVYKLYTALNSQARISKQPLFSGCSVLELSAPEEPVEQKINGLKWQVFTIRKIQLTPLQEGTLTLDKVYVDNVVQLLTEENLELTNFSVQVSNEPVTVEVKPLPVQGKPEQFSGVVGDYSIKASVDTNNIPAGENATLKITISGTGNIAGIRTPYIEWPSGTEHFDGTDTQYVNQQTFPVQGSRTFEIPFIGSKEGNVTIPSVKFSFFEPVTKTYKIIGSDSIAVTFEKTVSRADQLTNIVTEDVSNKKYLWIVAAIAIVVITVKLLADWWKKGNAKANSERSNDGIQPVTTEIKETDPAEIFNDLNQLGNVEDLHQFLGKTKILLSKAISEKTGMSADNEKSLLNGLGAHKLYSPLYDDASKIYRDCNRNLYAPLPDEQIKETIYFEVTAVIKQLYSHQSVNL
ncbi:MAG TPA: BatD family protein [Panacibacter sp.]|nr:BatD family protein [Panacibacter sp.]HNP43240.1 BatD family protein [Panacibacter sp.]